MSKQHPVGYRVDASGNAWWVPPAGRGFQRQDLGQDSVEAQEMAEVWNRRWRATRYQASLRGNAPGIIERVSK
jgi:hypothetical protein